MLRSLRQVVAVCGRQNLATSLVATGARCISSSSPLSGKRNPDKEPVYRKKILRKYDREIIKKTREHNASHEAKAEALNLPWRTVCATVLHRYPVITPDNEPWEDAHYDMEEELAEYQRKWLMEQLGDSDANLIGDDNPDYDEIKGSLPFDPAPRVSDADINNDTKSTFRKMTKSAFLLVKRNRNDHSWQFPQGKLIQEKDGSSGRLAAERIIDRACGKINRWFVSNAPIGHYCYAYPPDIQEKRGEYGAKVFFWRCQIIAGSVKLETRLYKDYAWVARDEIGDFVEDADTAQFLSAILPH